MQDKKFLTILGGATFVLVAGLIVYGIMQNSDIDENIKIRKKAQRKAVKIDPNTPSEAINQLLKKDKEQILGMEDKVISNFLSPVIGKYETPKLKLASGNATRKVFPFIATEWANNGWAQKFKIYYETTQKQRCADLNPVQFPDTKKIVELALRYDSNWDLDRRFKIQQLDKDKIPEIPVDMRKTITVGHKLGEDGVKKIVVKASPKAIRLAMDKFIVESVKKGQLYINKEGLPVPPVFAGQPYVNSLAGADAWNILVSTWVQQDIFNAIKQTNEYAYKQAGITDSAQKNLLNSAIKRVERIEISDMMNASLLSKVSSAIDSKVNDIKTKANMQGKDPAAELAKLYEVLNLPKIDNLTGWYPNRKFDVVNYSITVLMPSRYVSILQRKLIESSYHVILDQEVVVDVKLPTVKTKDLKLNANNKLDDALLTYYGVEPLSRVTIKGQLLLPTDFTRGKASKIVNNRPVWSKELPNIMPGTVLKKLFDTNKNLLRKEDLMSIGEYKTEPAGNQQ